jgi:uncharacterized protein (TIGR00725 family)
MAALGALILSKALHGLPIVAIIGSGSAEHSSDLLAAELGMLVARQHCHLLTGGGGGVMLDASRGFVSVKERQGLTIGVIPRATHGGPKPGYPNELIEVPIFTHLDGGDPASVHNRNPINVLTPCCVVALPGDVGTRAEAKLAVRYNTPICAVIDGTDLNVSAPFEESMRALGVPCAQVAPGHDGISGYDLEPIETFINGSPVTASGNMMPSGTLLTVGEHAATFDRR